MKDPIVQVGDPVLRAVAKPVAKKDIGSKKLNALVAKMKKALEGETYGVALAAPQVGASLRLFVVSGKVFLPEDAPEEAPIPAPRVFINPTLLRTSRKKVEMAEGCLSVRGTYGTVMRHEKATVKAEDETGNMLVHHGTGLLAHIFQHECDHLDGILYIDKAVKLEKDEDMQTAREKVKNNRGI